MPYRRTLHAAVSNVTLDFRLYSRHLMTDICSHKGASIEPVWQIRKEYPFKEQFFTYFGPVLAIKRVNGVVHVSMLEGMNEPVSERVREGGRMGVSE